MTLIGRAAERLVATRALVPPATLLVLRGPSGIGKTAFVTAVVEDVAAKIDSNFTLVTLSGSPSLTEVPFGVFRTVFTAEESDALGPVRASDAARAQAFAAEVAQSFIEEPAEGEPARPLVVHVHGAEHLDPLSLAALEWLRQRNEARVVMTTRMITGPLEKFVADTGATVLDLAPLGDHQIDDLITSECAPLEVDTYSRKRLISISGGNPLHLITLLAALRRTNTMQIRRGVLVWEGELAFDPTLSELLRAELDTLTSSRREIVDLLAYCEPLALPILLRLHDEADIEGLLDDGVIVGESASAYEPPSIRLAVPAHGPSIRAVLSPVRRRKLLEQLCTSLLATDFDSRPEDVVRAIGWSRQCGFVPPIAWLRHSIAQEHLARSEELTIVISTMIATHPDATVTERVSARVARAESLRFGGAIDDARVELAEARRQIESITDELARAKSVARWATVASDVELYGFDSPERAHSVFDDAVAVVAALGPTPRTTEFVRVGQFLDVAQAVLLGYSGALAEAHERLDELFTNSENPSDDVLLPGCAISILILAQRGTVNRAREIAGIWMPRAQIAARTHPWIAGEIASALFFCEISDGRIDAAAELNSRIAGLVDDPRFRGRIDPALQELAGGIVEFRRGRLSEAAVLLRASCARFEVSDGSGFFGYALSYLALCTAAQGNRQEAKSLIANVEHARLRISRVLQSAVRENLLAARIWIGEESAAAEAERLQAWCAERGLDLAEIRALHLRLLSTITKSSDESAQPLLERARLLAHRMQSNLGRLVLAHCEEVVAHRAPTPFGIAGRKLAARGIVVPVEHVTDSLTEREREISTLAALGYSSKAMAIHLGLASRTIDTHLGRAFVKLGINHRDDLPRALHSAGLD
ncbi:LuxR C-terminal-related transcriptional regulator [Humidisolicoccus flavus]|uniref:helix-turn-helix transcriptional regulator n=1 Tax=Humidisolicoccus flavus TaxID=3111414 RepID=UPI00324E0676